MSVPSHQKPHCPHASSGGCTGPPQDNTGWQASDHDTLGGFRENKTFGSSLAPFSFLCRKVCPCPYVRDEEAEYRNGNRFPWFSHFADSVPQGTPQHNNTASTHHLAWTTARTNKATPATRPPHHSPAKQAAGSSGKCLTPVFLLFSHPFAQPSSVPRSRNLTPPRSAYPTATLR